MAFIYKSIIFAFALSSLLAVHVEATGRIFAPAVASGKPDPALEKLCGSAEFPRDCSTSLLPFLSGTVNSHVVLQAGLKLIIQRSQKAMELAEQLKTESKSPETTDQLNVSIQNYQAICDSAGKAADALPAREFNKLESELANIISDIKRCEDVLGGASGDVGGKSPLVGMNMALRMAAKNNLNIGNFVAMPVLA